MHVAINSDSVVLPAVCKIGLSLRKAQTRYSRCILCLTAQYLTMTEARYTGFRGHRVCRDRLTKPPENIPSTIGVNVSATTNGM